MNYRIEIFIDDKITINSHIGLLSAIKLKKIIKNNHKHEDRILGMFKCFNIHLNKMFYNALVKASKTKSDNISFHCFLLRGNKSIRGWGSIVSSKDINTWLKHTSKNWNTL